MTPSKNESSLGTNTVGMNSRKFEREQILQSYTANSNY